MTKGNKKCKIKNRLMVGDLTKNLLQTQVTIFGLIKGITDIKFVITVAPQKDICLYGKIYPKKEVAKVKSKIKHLTIQTFNLIILDL